MTSCSIIIEFNILKYLFFSLFESQFIVEFKEHIQEQKKKLSNLEEGDFKQGLYDKLNLVEDILNDRINKSK